MPTYAVVPETFPAPPDVIVTASRNEIHATRFTPSRSGTAYAMGAWAIGSGLGLAIFQTARLAIYSHDGGANRPLNKLAESVEAQVHRDYPVEARGIFPLLASLHLDAGTFYWMAIHLDDDAPQAKWNVRGINGGGTSVLAVPSVYGTVPAVFPAGGVASANRMGLGVIYTPDQLKLDGTIVGTFLVGDGHLVGQPPVAHQNASVLRLNGKTVTNNVFADYAVVTPGKAQLILRGKAVSITSASSMVMGQPKLILKAKSVTVTVPTFAHMGKPWLTLRGKAFVTQSSSSPVMGKPWLLLKGKPVLAKIPGLVPTVPEDIILVPTVPEGADLVPTLVGSLDLVPTVEEFR